MFLLYKPARTAKLSSMNQWVSTKCSIKNYTC